MSNTFKMTGTLNLPKATEKFKPFSQRTSDSGWQMDRLRFNATCGDNRHMLSVDAGYWKDGHGEIYSFTKGGVDDNGNKVKGESIKIPFKDRLTDPRLAEVAEFKKFKIDTEESGRRYAMQNALDKMKEGKDISDELAAIGVANESELAAELEKSKKKRKEFISEKDFIEHIMKVIESGKYKDRLFNISGEIVYELNKETGDIYTKYVPNKIYLAATDAVPTSTGEFTVYYGRDSLDALSVEEAGKYYLNAFSLAYNPVSRKNDLPVPVTLVLSAKAEGDDKWEKVAAKLVKYFTVETDEYKEIGLKCNILDGAQRQELSIEDLDEETAENLELGLITMDDVKRELGISNTFGDRVREYSITGLMSGFAKGAKESVYTDENFVLKLAEDNAEADAILAGMEEDDI